MSGSGRSVRMEVPLVRLGLNCAAVGAMRMDLVSVGGREAGTQLMDVTVVGPPLNAAALQTLVTEHQVQVRKFDDSILEVLGRTSGEVMAESSQHDPLTQRVYESFLKFRKSAIRWGDLSERAYLNARSLKFRYGN